MVVIRSRGMRIVTDMFSAAPSDMPTMASARRQARRSSHSAARARWRPTLPASRSRCTDMFVNCMTTVRVSAPAIRRACTASRLARSPEAYTTAGDS